MGSFESLVYPVVLPGVLQQQHVEQQMQVGPAQYIQVINHIFVFSFIFFSVGDVFLFVCRQSEASTRICIAIHPGIKSTLILVHTNIKTVWLRPVLPTKHFDVDPDPTLRYQNGSDLKVCFKLKISFKFTTAISHYLLPLSNQA